MCSKMSKNTFFSPEMEKIPPIRIVESSTNHFQVLQVQPPALKINIVAGNRNPPRSGKLLSFKVTATRNDGSSATTEVHAPANNASKKDTQSVLKEPNDAPARPKSTLKKNKKSDWRWIYVKVEEPSKRLILSSHRFPEYPTTKINKFSDLQDLENQTREAYPNTQFSSD